MTVAALVRELIWGCLAGRFRPGDLVVREFGEWDEHGRSTYKAVIFLNPDCQPEHPDPTPPGCEGGINHTMFGPRGTLPARRLVELD